MGAHQVSLLLDLLVWDQPRVHFHGGLFGQDRGHTGSRVARPDSVDIQRRVEGQMKGSLFRSPIIHEDLYVLALRSEEPVLEPAGKNTHQFEFLFIRGPHIVFESGNEDLVGSRVVHRAHSVQQAPHGAVEHGLATRVDRHLLRPAPPPGPMRLELDR